MPEIEIGPDRIQIDAEIVARALKIAPQDLRDRMREGTVTSMFERGEGEDTGRLRLTFFSETRRARITATETGAVLTCTGVDYRRASVTSKKAANPDTAQNAAERHRLDALLDAALEETFPASDPIAVSFDNRRSFTRND